MIFGELFQAKLNETEQCSETTAQEINVCMQGNFGGQVWVIGIVSVNHQDRQIQSEQKTRIVQRSL